MNSDLLDWDLLSSYAGLLVLATVSIYSGSFGSLPNPKPVDGADPDDDDEENTERMNSGDAWLFPVVGSLTLFTLYTIVKMYGTEWINWVLGWYFSVAGVGTVWKSLIDLTRLLVGIPQWKSFDKISLLVRKGARKELLSESLRTPSLVLLPVAAVPSILYTFIVSSRKSALLTDILSLSFAHNAISLLKIDSFSTGCILLSGLFFYDIYWVFYSEVMVKVATSLDVPIKLLWPKSVWPLSNTRGYTMLGLGDIVIPATLISLALRYDHHRSLKNPSGTKTFSKPYFYAVLSGYVLGLTTTMFVMHVFKAAQPALLYLSPSCIVSFFVTASIRGELKDAWNWSDDPVKDDGKTTLEEKPKAD